MYKRLKEIYNSILHTLKKALMTLEKAVISSEERQEKKEVDDR